MCGVGDLVGGGRWWGRTVHRSSVDLSDDLLTNGDVERSAHRHKCTIFFPHTHTHTLARSQACIAHTCCHTRTTLPFPSSNQCCCCCCCSLCMCSAAGVRCLPRCEIPSPQKKTGLALARRVVWSATLPPLLPLLQVVQVHARLHARSCVCVCVCVSGVCAKPSCTDSFRLQKGQGALVLYGVLFLFFLLLFLLLLTVLSPRSVASVFFSSSYFLRSFFFLAVCTLQGLLCIAVKPTLQQATSVR